MRKLVVVVVLIAAAAASFVLLRPTPKSADASKPAESASNAPVAKASAQSVKPAPAPTMAPAAANPSAEHPNLGPRSAFLDSDVMDAIRKAVAAGDREGLDAAYQALVEYIRANPDKIDDYIASLRSEENEHVLRSLSRAMGESDVLWGDKLTRVAIDLAKDTSFKQRQHMMLYLMGQFPEMQEDVHAAVSSLTSGDPDSQVKTSAVFVLADWMQKFPERTVELLDEIGKIFKTAREEDVLVSTYQLLALHKEKLSREMHLALAERLRAEVEAYNRIPIVSALSAAPADIRKDAISYLESRFAAESDMEKKRNELAQIAALAGGESLPFLQKVSTGGDLLAQDASAYANLISLGPLDPESIFNLKASGDQARNPEPPHRE